MMLFVSSMPVPMFVPEFISLKEEFGITPLPKSNVKKFKKEMTLKRCMEIDPRFGKHPIRTRVLFKTFKTVLQMCKIMTVVAIGLFFFITILHLFTYIPQTYFIFLALIVAGNLGLLVIGNRVVFEKYAKVYNKISNLTSVGWNKIPYYTYRAHAKANDISIPINVLNLLNRVDRTYPVTIHVFDRDPFASVGTWPNEQYIARWDHNS
jgi:ABC-type uncharacterized transport system involved in gliding motility auxiliary subunit